MIKKRELKQVDNLFDDLLDEFVELEVEDSIIPAQLLSEFLSRQERDLDNKTYYKNLLKLQAELIKLQDWVVNTNTKVLIICEGRDSAGKGGVIKRITQRMDPRARPLQLRCYCGSGGRRGQLVAPPPSAARTRKSHARRCHGLYRYR